MANKSKWNELTEKEQTLLHSLGQGEKKKHLGELQIAAFGEMDSGTSTTRNTMRTLVESGFAKKVDRGTYSITPRGKREIPKKFNQEKMNHANGMTPRRGRRPAHAVVAVEPEIEEDIKVESLLKLALQMIRNERKHNGRRSTNHREAAGGQG